MSLKESINYTIWCDFIERSFLEGQFQDIIEDHTIHGATSNPAIFAQSISSSEAYVSQINMLQANDGKKIYEELAIADIKRAANLLYPLYEQDNDDGFISIEVDPSLCDDAQATIEEGVRLFETISYENVMIKVPATSAGYEAMKELTSKGINVNATLVFSHNQAIKCADALNQGITKSNQNTKAVISIFVSRFDRLCDPKFEELKLEKSKLGIVNATKCYHEIEKFQNKNIRTLFASTGVKGDDLTPSYYIDQLIFPHTINTAPLATIEAWCENGKKEQSNIMSEIECDKYFANCNKHKINIDEISDELLKDGLSAFKVSFAKLLKDIKKD
jgi:transaldolase